ncbi:MULTISPECIES: glycoside hydrolase family 3 C-terminal domain-containing protein [unclassified Mycobacterium]|uniref:beta-glucosidase family protein n=1 Tax=unclassified Mycobacterium TaxID=2642494 RepID=UPI00073FC54B|nr:MULTISPECIES: glycoside hydrolase family 3 C-terminal domain-containing protein [unclassified Mycobacterium]KUH85526.1 glycosyl hydrolase [Mycobacterium sp. GA-1999]KUH91384.1 glycosyl hydrolase [Mycobacterium sp. GA-0227b]KUH96361.1 glycosyl hydrolase [Mycobacterium sp. IS-1556]
MFDPKTVVAEMTLAEKAALVTGGDMWSTVGIDRLNVPSLTLTDGPHGVRRMAEGAAPQNFYECEPATAFPTAAATGSSWDPQLLEEIGAALGAESRALGVDVLLGPGVNIKRSPLCGRNFEYFSEDPVLSGELGAAWVRGLQRCGVGASVKHFAANNQETHRMRVSAEVDERTLREIYLPAFEHIVRDANPATVMAAYNAVNGVPAARNPWLLTEILRDDWQFAGVVVSDWGAVVDPVASLQAGLDLIMPGTGGGAAAATVLQSVASGTLEESVVDRAAERILAMAARLLNDRDTDVGVVDRDRHHRLARRAAAESAVLLTNDGLLPLDPARRGPVAVIGEFARTPRYQGGGSSHVRPTRIESALTELTAIVDGRCEIRFAPGFTLDDSAPEALLADAMAAARGAEVVLMFLGLPEVAESEGFDRTTLELPADQLRLLGAVASVNPNIAVVLSNGGVVLTAGVEQHARAVLEMWLPGQGGGGAAADILFGLAEPGGRLAETIPWVLTDTPAYCNFPGTAQRVLYGERHYVGYRWYDTTHRAVAHPFGHGLSYTTFDYSDLRVDVPDPGRSEATVSFTVTNTGGRAGSDVAQIYVSDLAASVDRPQRELKAFRKVHLAPGQSQQVEIGLSERDFAFWDDQRGAWTVEPGTFRIAVGASSRDLRLASDIDLTVPVPALPLTVHSSVGEWMARPDGREALLKLMAEGDNAQASTLQQHPELLRMVASMPLSHVLTLSGRTLPSAATAALLNAVNNTDDGP